LSFASIVVIFDKFSQAAADAAKSTVRLVRESFPEMKPGVAAAGGPKRLSILGLRYRYQQAKSGACL
jgi:hypothetical protein